MRWQDLTKPLTPWGYALLAEEHRHLQEDIRPVVVDGIATAAAEGDRSENAEYIYGKKRLREIDKRLRYLTGLIDEAEIVNPENIRSDRVEFGASVTVLLTPDEGESEERTYAIVGDGEARVERGTISWKSPLAAALKGKKIGSFFDFARPAGEVEVEVLSIEYKSLSHCFKEPS